MSEFQGGSYRGILRSMSIVGGASAVNILLSIVRTKLFAVLLGPSGVGLLGIYHSIMSTAAGLSGMGLNFSGVREIAEAHAKGDDRILADTRTALWRAAVFLGVMGAVGMGLLCRPISRWTLGSTEHATAIAVLGLGAFASVVTGSQTALLNGTRRIGDLARVSVYGGAAGTVFSVAAVWFLGERGILVVVVGAALISLAASSIYVALIPRPAESSSFQGQRLQLIRLLRLGVVQMSASLMSGGTLLAVRSLLIQQLGMEANGYFQAAWSVSMTYIGFVITAIGTDFYPQLTAAIDDRESANRMVNDHTEVALLVAVPIILGMLSFAPLVITVLYSSHFGEAITIFRWQLVGDVFKVAAYPVGLIMLAKSAKKLFFVSELGWNLLYVGLVLGGIGSFGLVATGVAFFVAYCGSLFFAAFVGLRLTGFRFRRSVLMLLAAAMSAAASICALNAWSLVASILVGGAITLGFGLYSMRTLLNAAAPGRMRDFLRRLPLVRIE